MKKIAFINHKGGCGKTTTLFHVAGELANRGYKVLVIDTDKQCDTSNLLLAEDESNYEQGSAKTIIDYIEGNGLNLNTIVYKNFIRVGNKKPEYKGIDVLTADPKLENQDLVKELREKVNIRNYFDIDNMNYGYDYVLIDCPPSNKAVEDMVLEDIATHVITPMTCDTNAVRGYGELLNVINGARKKNPELKMLGVFLSMYSAQKKKHNEYKTALSQTGTFIDVQIPYSSDVVTAVEDRGQPMCYYHKSKAREPFKKLVDVIERG